MRRSVLPWCGPKFSQWKQWGRNQRPANKAKTAVRPAGTVASWVDRNMMAYSFIWQRRSQSLCPPVVLPCWSTAVAPAKSSDEGTAQEDCCRQGRHRRAHCNSKGSAQQSGHKSGKKLRNDPSLTVITKSKQVTFASPSQFAPSQEQVCNETSLHASARVCLAAKCLWGHVSKNVKAYYEPQLVRNMTELCLRSRRQESIRYITCFQFEL